MATDRWSRSGHHHRARGRRCRPGRRRCRPRSARSLIVLRHECWHDAGPRHHGSGRMGACPTRPPTIDEESPSGRPADRQVPHLPRLGRRRRQDVRHARRGLAPPPAGDRRGHRLRRDPRPAAHGRADPGPAGRPPPGRRVPRHHVRGDGPRRGARPPPRGRARRRAGAHQRARVRAPREALGGRPRAARRRDRRDQHGQHPARREPGRRGRGDHRGARSASGSPTGWSAGPTRSS